MEKLKLRSRLRAGKVYRREQLAHYSSSVDRELKELVSSGSLKKLETGLYYVPKKTAFGEVPPDRTEVVKAFLKDDKFLMTSPNNYNSLGLGTTQLHNTTVVYNHKRHGSLNLGGNVFEFRVAKSFPGKLSKEFLLVDLLNNLDNLPEDANYVKQQVTKKLNEFDKAALKRMVKSFGKLKTKKFFEGLL